METELAPIQEDFTRRWNAALDEALLALGVDPGSILPPPGPLARFARLAANERLELMGDGDEALILDLSDLDPFAEILIEDGPSHALRTGENTALESTMISARTFSAVAPLACIQGFSRLELRPAPPRLAPRGDFLCGALRKEAILAEPCRSL